jgi:hypothetical protein
LLNHLTFPYFSITEKLSPSRSKRPFDHHLENQPLFSTILIDMMPSGRSSTSVKGQNNKDRKLNNNNHSPHYSKSGFITTLSPEGQIGKVIADMENLSGSHHLKNWSASARKELAPYITVAIEIQNKGKPVDIVIPKVALIAASPIFRSHMKDNPGDVSVKFHSQKVSLGAMQTIAKWLRKICSERDYTTLPLSGNLFVDMQLRMTARTLGMAQYIQEVEERYIHGLQSRFPEPDEVTIIIENTHWGDDPVVVALAQRMSFLCKYHKVTWEMEVRYANLLANDKYKRLLGAVKVGFVEKKRTQS